MVETAFLGSWALALKEVTGLVGASSWGGFSDRRPALVAELARAEAELLPNSCGSLQPVDWVAPLAELKAKLQTFWSAKLQEQRAAALREWLEPAPAPLRIRLSPT